MTRENYKKVMKCAVSKKLGEPGFPERGRDIFFFLDKEARGFGYDDYQQMCRQAYQELGDECIAKILTEVAGELDIKTPAIDRLFELDDPALGQPAGEKG